MRRLGLWILGAVVIGLLPVNIAYFAFLGWEKSEVAKPDTLTCELPGQDSTYTPAKWQWMPPGRVCVSDGRTFDEPGAGRALVVVVLPAALVGSIVLLARQTRRAMANTDSPDGAGVGLAV
jgi:hypothetical protein